MQADDTMSAAGDDLNNDVINLNDGARAQLNDAPGANNGRVEGKIRPATDMESGHVHYNSVGTRGSGSVACAGRREGLDVSRQSHDVGSRDHPIINVNNSNDNRLNFNNLEHAPSGNALGVCDDQAQGGVQAAVGGGPGLVHYAVEENGGDGGMGRARWGADPAASYTPAGGNDDVTLPEREANVGLDGFGQRASAAGAPMRSGLTYDADDTGVANFPGLALGCMLDVDLGSVPVCLVMCLALVILCCLGVGGAPGLAPWLQGGAGGYGVGAATSVTVRPDKG